MNERDKKETLQKSKTILILCMYTVPQSQREIMTYSVYTATANLFWLGTYEKYRTLRMITQFVDWFWFNFDNSQSIILLAIASTSGNPSTQVGFRSKLISHPVSQKHVMF